MSIICLASLMVGLGCGQDDPARRGDEIEHCRVVMVACSPRGLQVQRGEVWGVSWFLEATQRVALGVSTISRDGGPCVFGYTDAYLWSGMAWCVGMELGRAGFLAALEGNWYPIEGVQLAVGMDLRRGVPYVWLARTRE